MVKVWKKRLWSWSFCSVAKRWPNLSHVAMKRSMETALNQAFCLLDFLRTQRACEFLAIGNARFFSKKEIFVGGVPWDKLIEFE